MTDQRFVFAPAPVPSLPVTGRAERFPVHRIYCVGRNFADHAREMGHDPDREPPFFFQKNPDNLLESGTAFPYPPASRDVHHEIELVVALGRGGVDIAPAEAMSHVFGYAVGLDMTRRDLHGAANAAGRPWEVGKAFEASAPCSAILPVDAAGPLDGRRIHLSVNGATRQDGTLDQMIWTVPEMISILSGLFTLKAGDLIFAGTPAGVGPVEKGDVLVGQVDGIGSVETRVA